MRRSYRTGAAAAATATLLTGAGIAFASLREAPPPVDVAAISAVSRPAEPDLETLDAELADLRREANDLKAKIATRKKAAAAAAAADQRAASDDDDDESGATGAGSQTATPAPDVDATTGASGSGEDHEDEDQDEGEDEDEESGEDD